MLMSEMTTFARINPSAIVMALPSNGRKAKKTIGTRKSPKNKKNKRNRKRNYKFIDI